MIPNNFSFALSKLLFPFLSSFINFIIFFKYNLFFQLLKHFFNLKLFIKDFIFSVCSNISFKLFPLIIFLLGFVKSLILNIFGAIIEKSTPALPTDNNCLGDSFFNIFMLFSLLIEFSSLFLFCNPLLSSMIFKLFILLSTVNLFLLFNSFLFNFSNFLNIFFFLIILLHSKKESFLI